MNNNALSDITDIPANRALIDRLYEGNRISRAARTAALEAIHPHQSWALWINRLLLAFGMALVLSGIVYFFAFNWVVIPDFARLATIQAGLVCCIAGAVWQGLDTLTGKSLLTAASVLVGVFMAVFGQIYQTGADAYQLFMTWSLLTVGWTVLSGFVAQWMLWLAVTNTFIGLWWTQAALPTWEYRDLIFAITGLFNLAALAGRELFAHRAAQGNGGWAPPRWSRVVLVGTVILAFMPAMVQFMIDGLNDKTGITISALTGLGVLAGLLTLYRFYLPDMWATAAVVLGICIVTEAFLIDLVLGGPGAVNAFGFLVLGLLTLGLFTGAVIYLRSLTQPEPQHATDGRA